MVKYSEKLEEKQISVDNSKIYLKKRIKKLNIFRRILSTLFKVMSIIFDKEALWIGPVIDVVVTILFVGNATAHIPSEKASAIFYSDIFVCVFFAGCGFSITKEILKFLSSIFSGLSKKCKSIGVNEKYRDGDMLLKQLAELQNCYRLEELYVVLREKYPDRQIRFIKKKSEDKCYQAVTMRLEQVYVDPDSIVAEEDGALCKEFDFLIKKSLFKKIFGEEIDFTVIDEAYSEWQDALSTWTDTSEEENGEEVFVQEVDDLLDEKEEGKKELAEHLMKGWGVDSIEQLEKEVKW